jgi:hypothetical protein
MNLRVRRWLLPRLSCNNMALKCSKCGTLGINKDTPVYGPFEGEYEYLCRKCGAGVEMIGPLRWKKWSPRYDETLTSRNTLMSHVKNH